MYFLRTETSNLRLNGIRYQVKSLSCYKGLIYVFDETMFYKDFSRAVLISVRELCLSLSKYLFKINYSMPILTHIIRQNSKTEITTFKLFFHFFCILCFDVFVLVNYFMRKMHYRNVHAHTHT